MSYTVLIVDDSPIIRKMVARTLEMADLPIRECHHAANGREALDILEQQWIDIVFADINMPVMNGREMIQNMSEQGLLDTIPVVIISTERNHQRMEWLRAKGVSAYLNKPFAPEEFARIVRELLDPVANDRPERGDLDDE
jgi:two-component system chemotaxis response regulator CheY